MAKQWGTPNIEALLERVSVVEFRGLITIISRLCTVVSLGLSCRVGIIIITLFPRFFHSAFLSWQTTKEAGDLLCTEPSSG